MGPRTFICGACIEKSNLRTKSDDNDYDDVGVDDDYDYDEEEYLFG